MMYNITKRYTNNEREAQDALQEALIIVFRSMDKYKSTGSFTGWLKKIALTSGLKEIRKNRKHTLSIEMIESYPEKSWGENPVVIDKLALDDVNKIINNLPIDYRIAFNLYVIEGYSYDEISSILEIAVTTCRMRVSRARKKLYELVVKTEEYGLEAARKVD